jgi:hypothetical protein
VPDIDQTDCLKDTAVIEGSNETCEFVEDIDSIPYFSTIDAFASYVNVTLHAYYAKVMLPGAANRFQWGGSATSRSIFKLDVPDTTGQLRIRTTPIDGSSNIAIYAKYGDAPLVPHSLGGGTFLADYDCADLRSGGVNVCAVNLTRSGVYYVMIEGNSTYNVFVDAVVVRR